LIGLLPSHTCLEKTMNTPNPSLCGWSCGVTPRDLGLCTVPVAILFASLLTLL